MSLSVGSHNEELDVKDTLEEQHLTDTVLSSSELETSTGLPTPNTTMEETTTTIKPSTVHSELRVVTNVAELEAQSTPSSFNSHGLMPSLSPLAASYAATLKSNYMTQQHKSTTDTTMFAAMAKDLQFDPRFLAETWSQESPQSVYAWLAQPSAGMHSFSPLAVSPIGSRLMSPVMHQTTQQLHHQQQQQLFQAQQTLFPSSSSSSSHQLPNGLGSPLSLSPVSGRMAQYFSSQTLPPSPHFLHGLPPVSSTSNPSSSTDPTDTITSSSSSSMEAQAHSPTTLLRQLLPPIATRPLPLNAKDLTMHELRPHFNKPMAVVAKELGVCITLMKKICRRNGLVRWPHRRIRSLVNRITSLQVIANSAAPGVEKKRVLNQIFSLREELSAVIENPNEKSRKAQADAKIRSPLSSSMQTTSRFFPCEGGRGEEEEEPEGDPSDEEWIRKHRPEEMLLKGTTGSSSGSSSGFVASLLEDTPTTRSTVTGKRKGGYRGKGVVPPPIKIPRGTSSTRGRRTKTKGKKDSEEDEEEEEEDERPSSTGSNGKRGSISSILCTSSMNTTSIVI